MKIISIFVLFVTLAAFVHSEQEKNTLVLLDNLATRETHSIFFKNLQGKLFSKATSSFLINEIFQIAISS